jgi:hypothetical protein
MHCVSQWPSTHQPIRPCINLALNPHCHQMTVMLTVCVMLPAPPSNAQALLVQSPPHCRPGLSGLHHHHQAAQL